jgi:hypothetical protein
MFGQKDGNAMRYLVWKRVEVGGLISFGHMGIALE